MVQLLGNMKIAVKYPVMVRVDNAVSYFESFICILCLIMELVRIDIMEVSFLSSHLALSRVEHLEAAAYKRAYLGKKCNSRLAYAPYIQV